MAGYWVKEWIVPISASVARSVYVNRNFDKFYMVIVGEKKKMLILTQTSCDVEKAGGGNLFLTAVVAYISLVYSELQHEHPDGWWSSLKEKCYCLN